MDQAMMYRFFDSISVFDAESWFRPYYAVSEDTHKGDRAHMLEVA